QPFGKVLHVFAGTAILTDTSNGVPLAACRLPPFPLEKTMRYLPAFALLLALPFCALAQEKKGTEVKLTKLSGTTPADWKKEKPANLLRSYQFRLPEVKDMPGSEIVIFPESNPNVEKTFPKWKAQFVPPEGKTVDDISKTMKWDVKGAT